VRARLRVPATYQESNMSTDDGPRADCQLKFQSLSHAWHALIFPCDPQGRVDLNALDRRMLTDYLYARALVGMEFLRPTVLGGA
jgi:hypothetical protein